MNIQRVSILCLSLDLKQTHVDLVSSVLRVWCRRPTTSWQIYMPRYVQIYVCVYAYRQCSFTCLGLGGGGVLGRKAGGCH